MEFCTTGANFNAVTLGVSIPNGMEFYSFFRSIVDYPAFVSIPNGMEFYLESKPQSVQDTRFNSQRDGILLKNLH